MQDSERDISVSPNILAFRLLTRSLVLGELLAHFHVQHANAKLRLLLVSNSCRCFACMLAPAVGFDIHVFQVSCVFMFGSTATSKRELAELSRSFTFQALSIHGSCEALVHSHDKRHDRPQVLHISHDFAFSVELPEPFFGR